MGMAKRCVSTYPGTSRESDPRTTTKPLEYHKSNNQGVVAQTLTFTLRLDSLRTLEIFVFHSLSDTAKGQSRTGRNNQ